MRIKLLCESLGKKMITEAPAECMRYGTMHEWLRGNGLSHFQIVRLIEKGIIQKRPIPGCGVRAWYSASQIKEAVFNGWEGNGK